MLALCQNSTEDEKTVSCPSQRHAGTIFPMVLAGYWIIEMAGYFMFGRCFRGWCHYRVGEGANFHFFDFES